jgi:hypothetical protein
MRLQYVHQTPYWVYEEFSAAKLLGVCPKLERGLIASEAAI